MNLEGVLRNLIDGSITEDELGFLHNYSYKVLDKFNFGNDAPADIIKDAILSFYERFQNAEPSESYSSYYITVLNNTYRNRFIRVINKEFHDFNSKVKNILENLKNIGKLDYNKNSIAISKDLMKESYNYSKIELNTSIMNNAHLFVRKSSMWTKEKIDSLSNLILKVLQEINSPVERKEFVDTLALNLGYHKNYDISLEIDEENDEDKFSYNPAETDYSISDIQKSDIENLIELRLTYWIKNLKPKDRLTFLKIFLLHLESKTLKEIAEELNMGSLSSINYYRDNKFNLQGKLEELVREILIEEDFENQIEAIDYIKNKLYESLLKKVKDYEE